MCALLAVMALISLAAAIWGSVLGCKVTCCAGPTTGVRLNMLLDHSSIYLSIYFKNTEALKVLYVYVV